MTTEELKAQIREVLNRAKAEGAFIGPAELLSLAGIDADEYVRTALQQKILEAEGKFSGPSQKQ